MLDNSMAVSRTLPTDPVSRGSPALRWHGHWAGRGRICCRGSPLTPSRRTSGARVVPCATSVMTTTPVATTSSSGRCGKGAPLLVVAGTASAAASGITPRAPAHVTTAAAGHDRALRGSDALVVRRSRGSTAVVASAAPRTASKVSVTTGTRTPARAPSPDGSARMNVASCRPMTAKMTFSSTNTAVS